MKRILEMLDFTCEAQRSDLTRFTQVVGTPNSRFFLLKSHGIFFQNERKKNWPIHVSWENTEISVCKAITYHFSSIKSHHENCAEAHGELLLPLQGVGSS